MAKPRLWSVLTVVTLASGLVAAPSRVRAASCVVGTTVVAPEHPTGPLLRVLDRSLPRMRVTTAGTTTDAACAVVDAQAEFDAQQPGGVAGVFEEASYMPATPRYALEQDMQVAGLSGVIVATPWPWRVAVRGLRDVVALVGTAPCGLQEPCAPSATDPVAGVAGYAGRVLIVAEAQAATLAEAEHAALMAAERMAARAERLLHPRRSR